jgi:hypothetical protein
VLRHVSNFVDLNLPYIEANFGTTAALVLHALSASSAAAKCRTDDL